MDDLVRQCPPLDTNSRYLYLLQCHHHGDTCAAVRNGSGKLVGMLTGYIPPNQPDVLFVWQMAVHPDGRGQALARRMIEDVLQRDVCRDVKYVEATVTPSNKASRGVFESLAKHHETEIKVQPLFATEHFGGGDHEPEQLLRVGPLATSNQ